MLQHLIQIGAGMALFNCYNLFGHTLAYNLSAGKAASFEVANCNYPIKSSYTLFIRNVFTRLLLQRILLLQILHRKLLKHFLQ